jgi:hypothetical protein
VSAGRCPLIVRSWECFALTETASLLPVLGSSLTVQSGYRSVLHAAGLGILVAIINQGPTKGDDFAARGEVRSASVPEHPGALRTAFTGIPRRAYSMASERASSPRLDP